MTKLWFKGLLVDVGEDDNEAILEIAQTIESAQPGHMIDRWNLELSDEERSLYLGIGTQIWRRLKAMGKVV